MKKSHLLGAVCACLFVSFNANAASLTSPISGPGYDVFDNCPGCPGETNINVAIHDNIPITLDFDAIGAPFESIFIQLDNYTGGGWNNLTIEYMSLFDPYDPVQLGLNIFGTGGSTHMIEDILINPFTLAPSGLVASFTPPESLFVVIDGFADRFSSNPFDQYSITISTSAVPIPATVWLFGSGILGLIGIARRKNAA